VEAVVILGGPGTLAHWWDLATSVMAALVAHCRAHAVDVTYHSREQMKRTSIALLCGFVLIGAQAVAQDDKEAPKAKETPKSVYVVGVTGMT